MQDRHVFRLSGADNRPFLQGLVTNDVDKVDAGLVYAALLTPQGKYLADFFLAADGADILLDVAAELAPGLSQRLSMYKLRADVAIADSGLHVHRGVGAVPADAHPDPRHAALGWRAYRAEAAPETDIDWTALRVAHVVPETGIELTPDSYILEAGFEALHGVDFRKGCYVGQEVTARMKHKTTLRKGLAQVGVDGSAAPGTEITADGKAVGTLFSTAGTQGIAYLRFDRAKPEMQAGSARITWDSAGN
ncbi:MAG: folate-binding protein [Pseudomonadota bacterium]